MSIRRNFIRSFRIGSHVGRLRTIGAPAAAVEATDKLLQRQAIETVGVITLSEARNHRAYMTAADDEVSKPRRRWMNWVLMPVATLEGAVTAYVLGDVVAVDASPRMLHVFAAVVGVITAALLSFGMHTAGRHTRWGIEFRTTLASHVRGGGSLPVPLVSLSDPQDEDAVSSVAARKLARINRRTSMLPAYACGALVLFLVAAMSLLRHEELVQLRKFDSFGLPSDTAFITGIVVLAVLFIALQVAIFWVAYATVFLGRESERAWRALHYGKLASDADVIAHNYSATTAASEVQVQLYERVGTIAVKDGLQLVSAKMSPGDVLAEMLKERGEVAKLLSVIVCVVVLGFGSIGQAYACPADTEAAPTVHILVVVDKTFQPAEPTLKWFKAAVDEIASMPGVVVQVGSFSRAAGPEGATLGLPLTGPTPVSEHLRRTLRRSAMARLEACQAEQSKVLKRSLSTALKETIGAMKDTATQSDIAASLSVVSFAFRAGTPAPHRLLLVFSDGWEHHAEQNFYEQGVPRLIDLEKEWKVLERRELPANLSGARVIWAGLGTGTEDWRRYAALSKHWKAAVRMLGGVPVDLAGTPTLSIEQVLTDPAAPAVHLVEARQTLR